jgi:dTDP-4-amino-4,6-dideoxygalactose transaminase
MRRLRQTSEAALAIRGGAPVRAIPLPPWPPALEPAEAEELLECLRRGPDPLHRLARKRAFEKEFAAWCGVRFAIAVNSGTTALDLAVETLGLPDNAVVLAADYGHPSTIRYAAAHHRLRLLDVTADTCCLDEAAVAGALDEGGVGCVITTHFAGQPAGAARLARLCAERGVPLIEDAAHAHGAIAAGRRAGSFGSFGCFSLHDTKALPAGEGGVVVTDHAPLAERLWKLHDIGRAADGQPYDFIGLGGNFRLSELAATLASLRLRRLESDLARRQAAADEVQRSLPEDAPLVLLRREPDVELHGYHFLAARYRPEYCRGLSQMRFVLALNAEGIVCSTGWPRPLHALPEVRVPVPDTPNTMAAIAESVWIDQRLLLERDGPAQIVEAILRVQRLADSLGRRP